MDNCSGFRALWCFACPVGNETAVFNRLDGTTQPASKQLLVFAVSWNFPFNRSATLLSLPIILSNILLNLLNKMQLAWKFEAGCASAAAELPFCAAWARPLCPADGQPGKMGFCSLSRPNSSGSLALAAYRFYRRHLVPRSAGDALATAPGTAALPLGYPLKRSRTPFDACGEPT